LKIIIQMIFERAEGREEEEMMMVMLVMMMVMNNCVVCVHIDRVGKYVRNRIIELHRHEHQVTLKATIAVKQPVSKTQSV
jgi:hypothetical protein